MVQLSKFTGLSITSVVNSAGNTRSRYSLESSGVVSLLAIHASSWIDGGLPSTSDVEIMTVRITKRNLIVAGDECY